MAKARTAAQRAALRKAQLASARKRRGRGKKRTVNPRRSAAAKKSFKKQQVKAAMILTAAALAPALAGITTHYGLNAAMNYSYNKRQRKRTQQPRQSRAQASRDRQAAEHLRRMKYGRGGFVPSQRVRVGPQLALPRGKS